jgi:hypothetical protein
VYVVWQDCRFEPHCASIYGSANDIVMSTSTDGLSWSAVERIPIDPVGSGVHHIIPGIGVDKHTSGSNAHLALTFYYFPVAGCFPSTASWMSVLSHPPTVEQVGAPNSKWLGL